MAELRVKDDGILTHSLTEQVFFLIKNGLDFFSERAVTSLLLLMVNSFVHGIVFSQYSV